METEEGTWRPVPTHEGYCATRDGKIKGSSGKVLKLLESSKGYLYVSTCRKPRKLYAHRAVLLAFVGLPGEGQESRHLNGVRSDNRLDNLTWGTRRENREDMSRHGTELRGQEKPQAKLSNVDVFLIRHSYPGLSLRALGALFNVHHKTIYNIVKGNTWAHLEA